MKRLYLILLLTAVTLSGMAQTIGEEMYIYRSDGQVNGFLPDEVLGIEFSYEDADGNTYDEIVTQIVNTADSIYMIPLAEIDSISFITPKTEYKTGVINLSDELMPYVVSSTDLSITFSGSTPNGIMPRVGDKLVTLEMNDKFPAGFVGEVTAVSGTQVTCSKVSLEDVFDSYHAVSSTYGYQEGDMAPRYLTRRASSFGNKDFKLGTFTWSKSAELSLKLFGSDNLALKGGTQLSIGITPSFHVISTLIVNKEEGTYFSACITGDITLQESVSIYGGIEWSNDFLDNEWVKAPVAPLTFFYVKPGLFFRASATVTTSATWTQRFTMGAAFDFSTKKRSVIKPTCGGRLASSSFDIEGAIDGSVAVGGFMEVGLTLASSDIDKLCFRGELGAELVGHAVLYNADVESAPRETKVYERFKNSNIAVNAFVSTAVQAECGPWGISYSLPWNLSYNIKTWDVVPTFSNTSFKQKMNPQTSADASADMSGDCLVPVMVGLSVRDKNGEEVGSHYAEAKFDNGNKPLSHTFANLSAEEDYTLYPKVRIFGYEMLASPSAELNKTEMTVKITDFKQTDSHYEKDAYTNNGQKYSYKYDCAVTVELTNSENIEDWGYVYKDPYGQIASISLRSYGSPYTDTRYSYYRNESSSTVTLYEYVKYTGDSEYYYGEPHDYSVSHQGETSCPDANHPHMIDLGLPSGTKWACCNVGASSPVDFGGYYAWGEIGEKNQYVIENYAYYDVSHYDANQNPVYPISGFINIGSDISGTSYDVVNVKWGKAWQMPTEEQCRELINNATWTQTSQNGINGMKFVGTNGSSIFIPAAGNKWNSDTFASGKTGSYWTSSLYSSIETAWCMFISADGVVVDGNTRYGGMSIRPIQPGMEFKTGDATEVKITSALLNGSVENYNPKDETIQFAFFYSTSSDVMNASDGKSIVATYDNNGNLSAEITDLSDYTTYYYTLAVKRGESKFETSEIKSFTTLPVVSTLNNATTTYSSATLSGTCSKGITVTGFSVKKENASEYATYSAVVDADGNFSATIDGLDANSKYYYYAFIKDGEKTCPGEEYQFTTKQLPITVVTGDVSNVKANSATLSGTVENYNPSDENVSFVFFYSTSSDVMNTSDGKSVAAIYDNNGNLTAEVTNLKGNTTYYYATAYKIENEGFVFGEVKSFKTDFELVVVTGDVTDISFTTATLHGSYSGWDNNWTLQECGFAVKKGDGQYLYSISADIFSDGVLEETLNYNPDYDFIGIEAGETYTYFAYVKYNDKIVRGEEKTYTIPSLCSSHNHPHLIDLGLPSGTKWACLNVGAEEPSDGGDTFAWGEILKKGSYEEKNYLYKSEGYGGVNPIYIGDDISGTAYDVATSKWGDSWKMPSKKMMEELSDGCHLYGDYRQKGVKGILCVGSTLEAIFLPNTEINTDNYTRSGCYWSSTLRKEASNSYSSGYWEGLAYYLECLATHFYITYQYRYNGFFVRPVH